MSTTIKPINKTFTAGKWMPRDRETLVNWMQKVMDKAEKDTGPLLPVVENLKNFIETDAKAYMFFNQMFDEVPADKKKTLLGLPQVRDYQHMLRLFNVILTHAPSFNGNRFRRIPVQCDPGLVDGDDRAAGPGSSTTRSTSTSRRFWMRGERSCVRRRAPTS